MTNPFNLAKVRGAIYTAVIVLSALTAGFEAVGEIPSWLIFLTATTAVLSGGTSLTHLTPDSYGDEDG